MTETMPHQRTGATREVTVEVVDADVHPAPRTTAELREYLPEPWRSRQWPEQTFNGTNSSLPYTPPSQSERADAKSPSGGPGCSDPEFTERQLFGDAGIDYAILIPLSVRSAGSHEQEAAIAAATNNWLDATWLSKYNAHGRYRGTLRVCAARPDLAVQEIERWGGHPYFCQVMINPYVSIPLGQPHFHPVFEAAARHGMPIALHVNRVPGAALLTPVGPASYFIEHHSLYPLLYTTHFNSLICEGVFERFPTLRVVFDEGGFSWLLPALWSLDNHWDALRSDLDQVKRRPSEYVREHIRFSSQPIEEPSDPHHLDRVLEWLDAEHILMFATDYPHWDGDYDPRQLFRTLPKSTRHRILAANALELYNLPTTRPASGSEVARS